MTIESTLTIEVSALRTAPLNSARLPNDDSMTPSSRCRSSALKQVAADAAKGADDALGDLGLDDED